VNRIKVIERCSVYQHDSTDCGAACLASVIKYFGGTTNIEKIRQLSGTTQAGTSMLGLYQAAKDYGIEATGYEATIDDILCVNDIFILHVRTENGFDHYNVYYGFDHGKFIIWDPATGIRLLTREELDKIWLTKRCLALVPGNSFKLEKEDRRERKDWIQKSIKPEKDLLVISVVIGIVVSILGLVMAVFTQKLIDKILPTGDIRTLIVISVLVFLLLSSRIIISAVRQFLLLTQGKHFNIRIVDDFYSSLLFLPKSFFDTRKTGDFVARLNDTMRIQKVISDIIGVYAIDILILISTIIVLFYYSIVSAIMSIIFLPVLYLTVKRWNGRVLTAQHNLMAGYSASESNFINSLGGIQEIKSMNLQDLFFKKNNEVYTEFQEKAYLLGKIKLKLNLLTGLIGTFYIILILIYSSIEVIGHRSTQGELMAILSLSSTMLPSVLNLALIGIPMSEAKVALNRMFEFTQLQPEQDRMIDEIKEFNISRLEIKNIFFRFPGSSLLLENICLSLEKGKLVSLVGESGCGKSTLANIILRFYRPESGEIVINGYRNSDNVGLKNWRSKIGIIPQEIHIFNGTILQNILSELTESKFNEMTSIISEYGLDMFINRFPSGLLTLVGEEGINLSGGEKQLLAFIRVLINKPDILIIDEGTSSMDRGTESMIINLLKRLKSQMGILLISHRINVIRNLSDDIYIIEKKTITEQGTHRDLLASDNLYRRFWDDFY
jgi:ATP-binding cassette, subfamily C, bacteriocin exporter